MFIMMKRRFKREKDFFLILMGMFFVFDVFPIAAYSSDLPNENDVATQILLPDRNQYPVQNLRIWVDKEGTATFDDVLNADNLFTFSSGKAPNFGFTSSAIWLHFRIQNQNPDKNEWLLEIAYPLLDSIALYEKNAQQQWVVRQSGDHWPYDKKEIPHRYFLFRLNIPAGETAEYYLRVQSESSVQIPLTVYTIDRFVSNTLQEQFIFGGFYGILILITLYNLFFFISIRDKNYFYYVLYISFFIIGQMGIDGFAYEFLWPNHPDWNNRIIVITLSVALFWCGQFSKTFLNLRVLVPRMNQIINLFLAVTFIVFLMAFVAPYSWTIIMIANLTVILSIILLISGILCWLRNYRPARYFLGGWAAYFIGISIFAFKSMGLLPYMFITHYGTQIGAIMQVTLLSLGLANRYNLLKQELAEQKLQTEILEREKEKERKALIEEQKRELEIQVAERTRDLSEKTDELEKINRIVKAINSEIDFSSLLETFLNEANLIDETHRACILALEKDAECFKVKMTRGWSVPGLAAVTLSHDEIENLFVKPTQFVFQDIGLIRASSIAPKLSMHDFFGKPASRLVLRIANKQNVLGFFIFDNLESESAFTDSHLKLLYLLKEHIISAFIKIKLLEELKIVNEQKNEFLGIAAHDLRSPLGAVIGFVELVVEDLRQDRYNKEEIINDLSIVLRSSRDMVQLISDLLDISAIETGKVCLELHQENMLTIFDECERMNRKAALMKNITLEFDRTSNLPTVMIDKIRILEVMNNLVSNAIKYTYPGGHIRVYCEVQPSLIATHVQDTGQGLNETDIKHIFTGFKKLSSRPTGGETSTGFGLAIVKKIVDLHHGKIWVTSEPGKGSTFSFSLPIFPS